LKIPSNIEKPRSFWENLIEEWIFSEEHRLMLKRNLLDGWTYERIAEEFDMSSRQIARIIPRLQEQLFKHIS
jgi:AraC-like DNA-binding protein